MSARKRIPRIVVAALRGGAGKTFVTVGITAALTKKGLSAAVFKKGPDYIDAGWLGLSAGRPCYNLDPYLFDNDTILYSLMKRSAGRDAAIIEGNRGVFDGVDSAGSFSTAELAKLLKAPVLLIVDATKMTRTAAALVLGCRTLDPELDLKGVILNRVGGPRHESVLRSSIEQSSDVPVIGSIRKLNLDRFPQRHLGLLPWHEHPHALGFVEDAAKVSQDCIDIEAVMNIAEKACELEATILPERYQVRSIETPLRVRIGVLMDSAFQFYYPENLEALTGLGAQLVEISALTSKRIPEIDALYIGGGFPETHAESLARNVSFRESVRNAAERGLPIYAECGGLMFLARRLIIDENSYPMAGVFPLDTVLDPKPQGHGYIQAEVDRPNPFYPQGSVLTGHEFHYSYIGGLDESKVGTAFRVLRGHGINGSRDGICRWNVLATYLHIHALGERIWAESLVRKAVDFSMTGSSRIRDEEQGVTEGSQGQNGKGKAGSM